MKNYTLLRVALVLIAVTLLTQQSIAQCDKKAFSLIELFTSQGCSSCPTAEQILDDIQADETADGREVLIIAEHCTFFDNQGWKDVFGNTVFNSRLQKYGQVLNTGIGTPMFIGNGNIYCTTVQAIYNSSDAALASTPATGVCLSTTSAYTASTINVDYEISGTYTGAHLFVALVENNLVVNINAGENSGKTLTQNNVVRVFKDVTLSAATGSVAITPPANCVRNNSRIVAWLQNPSTMKVLGGTTGFVLNATTTVPEQQQEEVDFSVFPNPAAHEITVTANVKEPAELIIVAMDGSSVISKVIQPGVNDQVDVSILSAGVYTIQLKTKSEVYNKKLVITRN